MAIAIRSNGQISYPFLSAGAFTAALAVRETGPAGAPKPRLLDRVREASNVFFGWAEDHHEPHYQQVSEAQSRYSALVAEFDDAVGDLGPEELIAAYRWPRRRAP